MSDLAEFLLARLTEREDMARQASTGYSGHAYWRVVDVPGGRAIGDRARDVVIYPSTFAVGQMVDHIAANDPAYVLADCSAKRRIVEEHHQAGDDSWSPYKGRCAVCGEYQDWPCTTLKLLALPYADHPDFPKDLRP